MHESLRAEIKQLIVEALMLEDVSPAEISDDAPLFGDGLGLDSIDALELAIALDRKYGVKIAADDAATRDVFHSVAHLAAHVAAGQALLARGTAHFDKA